MSNQARIEWFEIVRNATPSNQPLPTSLVSTYFDCWEIHAHRRNTTLRHKNGVFLLFCFRNNAATKPNNQKNHLFWHQKLWTSTHLHILWDLVRFILYLCLYSYIFLLFYCFFSVTFCPILSATNNFIYIVQYTLYHIYIHQNIYATHYREYIENIEWFFCSSSASMCLFPFHCNALYQRILLFWCFLWVLWACVECLNALCTTPESIINKREKKQQENIFLYI